MTKTTDWINVRTTAIYLFQRTNTGCRRIVLSSSLSSSNRYNRQAEDRTKCTMHTAYRIPIDDDNDDNNDSKMHSRHDTTKQNKTKQNMK